MSLYKYTIFNIICLLPFLYYQVGPVRVVYVLALLLLPVLIIQASQFVITTDVLLYIFFMVIALSFSLASSNYEIFSTIFVSFILTYWSSFFPNVVLNEALLRKLIRYYLYGVFLVALIIIMQFIAYHYNIFTAINSIFKCVVMGNRVGFSATFQDYSFVSIYLVSALPLIYGYQKKYKALFAALVLAASVVCSARSGVAALIIWMLYLLVFGWRYGRKFYNKVWLLLPVLLPLLFYVLLEVYNKYIRQGQSFDDGSGRISTFKYGWHVIQAHPFFGLQFQNLQAHKIVSPHNMIIFILTFCGFVSLIILLVWALSVVKRIRRVNKTLQFSLIIIVIGLQFVPSPFSCYYLFALLGIVLADSKAGSHRYQVTYKRTS